MIQYIKVDPGDTLGAYEVIRDGVAIGFVWKEEVFTYLGTEGWNAGVRIRDFYPIEWKCGTQLGSYNRLSHKTRNYALRELLELLKTD